MNKNNIFLKIEMVREIFKNSRYIILYSNVYMYEYDDIISINNKIDILKLFIYKI